MPEFHEQIGYRPGERVEFRSGDRGGCWKPATVDRVLHGGESLRLDVGNGVRIVRPAANCRRVP